MRPPRAAVLCRLFHRHIVERTKALVHPRAAGLELWGWRVGFEPLAGLLYLGLHTGEVMPAQGHEDLLAVKRGLQRKAAWRLPPRAPASICLTTKGPHCYQLSCSQPSDQRHPSAWGGVAPPRECFPLYI